MQRDDLILNERQCRISAAEAEGADDDEADEQRNEDHALTFFLPAMLRITPITMQAKMMITTLTPKNWLSAKAAISTVISNALCSRTTPALMSHTTAAMSAATPGLHAVKDSADPDIVGKRIIEQRDQREDEKRRKDGAGDADEHAWDLRQLVADDNGPIDRDRPRRRLSNGSHIQHFLLFDPVISIHEALFHQRNDDIPSAKGKRAQHEGRGKQFPKPSFFHIHSPLSLSLYGGIFYNENSIIK